MDVSAIISSATGVVAVASAFTALFPTPTRPSPDDSWRVKLWWIAYQVIEVAAMVTQRVKERPNAAAAIIAAAQAGKMDDVVAAATRLGGTK